MDKETKNQLEKIEGAMERAQPDKVYSKQPRFSRASEYIFQSIMYWIKDAGLDIPLYRTDSRNRDQWLRQFALREPHWNFAVNQGAMIDANRRWTLTGGRNQVYRYLAILHQAEDGLGWRHYAKKGARAFRVTDMGSITELGRDGEEGPLRALYHLDSAKCKLTGNPDQPLNFYPRGGRMQKWGPNDYFRVTPMPQGDETFNDLGFCATSMAFEITKILYAVLMHDQEQVLAKMPKAFVLFGGIDDTQFNQAMEMREEDLEAKNRAYFGGIIALFSSGFEQEPSATMVALSNLPAGFNREIFIDQCLYAYAGILGLDPAEIWPVRFGSLGRGTEMQLQHRKAATKGVYDYALTHQELLQAELADTITFEYEQRDAEGELLDAEVAQAWAEVAATLYDAGKVSGIPLLEREQSLSLLAQHGIIPPEWSEIEEETQATDVERSALSRMQERALSSPYVQRAIAEFPDEPIIRYMWPEQRVVTLWSQGQDALGRQLWSGAKVREVEETVLYDDPDGDFQITMEDVDRAIRVARRRVGPEYAALLDAEPLEEMESE